MRLRGRVGAVHRPSTDSLPRDAAGTLDANRCAGCVAESSSAIHCPWWVVSAGGHDWAQDRIESAACLNHSLLGTHDRTSRPAGLPSRAVCKKFARLIARIGRSRCGAPSGPGRLCMEGPGRSGGLRCMVIATETPDRAPGRAATLKSGSRAHAGCPGPPINPHQWRSSNGRPADRR